MSDGIGVNSGESPEWMKWKPSRERIMRRGSTPYGLSREVHPETRRRARDDAA
ncbi:MAG: hypothetical protein WCS96_00435 [Victivallales bacterium]